MMSTSSVTSSRRVTIRKPAPRTTTVLLGVAVWVIFFVAWELAVIFEGVNPLLVPPPEKVLTTLGALIYEGRFVGDIAISVLRVVGSFAGACLVAVPLGILMGTFSVAESFFNPFVSAWRYLPAPAFIPILLMWLGTGEGPKLALLFIGVVFFLITLVMDYTRQVRIELIETSLTLGASQKQVLWTVIVPAVLPNVVVAMRQMLLAMLLLLWMLPATAPASVQAIERVSLMCSGLRVALASKVIPRGTGKPKQALQV